MVSKEKILEEISRVDKEIVLTTKIINDVKTIDPGAKSRLLLAGLAKLKERKETLNWVLEPVVDKNK